MDAKGMNDTTKQCHLRQNKPDRPCSEKIDSSEATNELAISVIVILYYLKRN